MQLAPPKSELGQFQRGLGSGLLWAVEQTPKRAGTLIEDCLRSDPRWDHQVDSRSDYYAEIILRTGVDFGFLEHLLDELRDRDHLEEEDRQVIQVVGCLSARKRADAILALRHYVATSSSVFDAPEQLGRTAQPDTWDGLDAVVSGRFPEDDDLARQVRWPPYESPPWTEWLQAPTRVG